MQKERVISGYPFGLCVMLSVLHQWHIRNDITASFQIYTVLGDILASFIITTNRRKKSMWINI